MPPVCLLGPAGGLTPYEEAIKGVGRVLEFYDSDRIFQVGRVDAAKVPCNAKAWIRCDLGPPSAQHAVTCSHMSHIIATKQLEHFVIRNSKKFKRKLLFNIFHYVLF